MSDFLNLLFDPDISFLRIALISGILASISFGITGTYITVKRISYLTGAIAHASLLGVGASLVLRYQFGFVQLSPVVGTMIVSVCAALCIGIVHIYKKEREDTLIGAVWSMGMAGGFLLLFLIPQYVDPSTYLFGNILIISQETVIHIIIIDIITIVMTIGLYHRWNAVIFDEEFVRSRGISTSFYYILLLVMSAVTIVIMTQIVGIVIIIATMTLPAAIGLLFRCRLWVSMIIATLFSMLFMGSGIVGSYILDIPAGATITLITGTIYLLCIGAHFVLTKLRRKIGISISSRPRGGIGASGEPERHPLP